MVCGAKARLQICSAIVRHDLIRAVSTRSSSVKSTRRYEPVEGERNSNISIGSAVGGTVTDQSSLKLSTMPHLKLAMQPVRSSARTGVLRAHTPRRLRLTL